MYEIIHFEALACPRLSKPEFGTILPTNCMYGDTFAGERCFLHCPSGYKAVGKRVAICNHNLKWHPRAELQCIPVRAPSAQLTSSPTVKQHSQQYIRPTIKCHEDMTIVKPKNHETILVHIPKPETNVNWESYVDSQPVWGKKLEAILPLGASEVVFRARSPHNNMFDMCRMIINVIGKQHLHTAVPDKGCNNIDDQEKVILNLSLFSYRTNSSGCDSMSRAFCCSTQSSRNCTFNILERANIRE